jgi:hypothetical protein
MSVLQLLVLVIKAVVEARWHKANQVAEAEADTSAVAAEQLMAAAGALRTPVQH